MSVTQVDQSQQIAESLEADQIAGAGAQITYIQNEDAAAGVEEKTIDAATLSNIQSSISSASPSNVAATKTEDPSEDSPNYVRNNGDSRTGSVVSGLLIPDFDAEMIESGLDNSPPPPPPPDDAEGSSGAGGGGSVYDTMGDIEEDLEDMLDNFDEEDYYTDEDGFMYMTDEQAAALADHYNKVMAYCYLLMAIQMVSKNQQECRNLVHEEMTGLKGYKGMDTATIVGNYCQNRMLMVSTQVTDFLTKAMEENQERFDELQEQAENKNDSCGEQTGDYFSGGENTKEMLEGMEKANKKFLKATEQIMNLISIMMGRLLDGDPNAGISDIADVEAFLEDQIDSLFTDLPSIAKDCENGYQEVDEELMEEMQAQMTALANARNMVSITQGAEAETRNLVHQEMTGISGRKSQARDVDKLRNVENSHISYMFEAQANLTMQKVQLNNQINYFQKQLEKLDTTQVTDLIGLILKLIGTIVALAAPGIGTIIGLVISAIGTIVEFAGKMAAEDSVNDSYNPTMGDDKTEEQDTDTGNVNTDILNACENQENDILDGIDTPNGGAGDFWDYDNVKGNDWVDVTGDDFYAVNEAAFMAATDQLAALHNIMRVVYAIHNNAVDMRDLVHMEMTGIGGLEADGERVEMAIEMEIRDARLSLTLARFKMSEWVQSKNIEIQGQKAVDNAVLSFILQLGCMALGAIVGGAIGGGIGIAIGIAIGQAIAAFIAEIVYQLTIGSYGDDYNVDQEYFAQIRNDQSATQDLIDAKENEIYEDLMNGDNIIDAGDDMSALNADLIAGLRGKLAALANIRKAIIMLHKAMADNRKLVHLEMTGVTSSGHDYSLSENVATAEYQVNMEKFDMLVNYLRSKVDMLNRAAQASRSLEQAGVKFLVSMVVAGICAIAGSAASIMLQLLPVLMQLAGMLVDFAYAVSSSTADNGQLDAPQDPINNVLDSKHKNDVNSAQNRIDQLEQDLYYQASQDLLASVSAGQIGANASALAFLNNKMEKVFKVKDAIAKLQEASAQLRSLVHVTMTGKSGRVSDASKAHNVDQMASALILADMFEKSVALAMRENQRVQAERAMWQALVNIAITIVIAIVAAKAHDANAKVEDTEAALNESGKEGLDCKERMDHIKAVNDAKTLAGIQFALQLARIIASYATGVIFDAAKESQAENDFGKVEDGVKDAPQDNAKINSAKYRMQMQANAIDAQNNKEFAESFTLAPLQAAISFASTMHQLNMSVDHSPKTINAVTKDVDLPVESVEGVELVDESKDIVPESEPEDPDTSDKESEEEAQKSAPNANGSALVGSTNSGVVADIEMNAVVGQEAGQVDTASTTEKITEAAKELQEEAKLEEVAETKQAETKVKTDATAQASTAAPAAEQAAKPTVQAINNDKSTEFVPEVQSEQNNSNAMARADQLLEQMDASVQPNEEVDIKDPKAVKTSQGEKVDADEGQKVPDDQKLEQLYVKRENLKTEIKNLRAQKAEVEQTANNIKEGRQVEATQGALEEERTELKARMKEQSDIIHDPKATKAEKTAAKAEYKKLEAEFGLRGAKQTELSKTQGKLEKEVETIGDKIKQRTEELKQMNRPIAELEKKLGPETVAEVRAKAGIAGAAAQAPVSAQATTQYKDNKPETTSSKPLLDYADKIESDAQVTKTGPGEGLNNETNGEEVKDIKKHIEIAKKDLAKAEVELKEAHAKYSKVRAERTEIEKQIEKNDQDVKKLDEQIAKLEDKINKAEEKGKEPNQKDVKKLEELNAKRSEKLSENDRLKDKLKTKEHEVKEAKSEVDEAKGQRYSAKAHLKELRKLDVNKDSTSEGKDKDVSDDAVQKTGDHKNGSKNKEQQQKQKDQQQKDEEGSKDGKSKDGQKQEREEKGRDWSKLWKQIGEEMLGETPGAMENLNDQYKAAKAQDEQLVGVLGSGGSNVYQA